VVVATFLLPVKDWSIIIIIIIIEFFNKKVVKRNFTNGEENGVQIIKNE